MKPFSKIEDIELLPAENTLWELLKKGGSLVLGNGYLPDLPDTDADNAHLEAVTVRASFVRFLAMGGCEGCKVPESGLRLRGALIIDDEQPEHHDKKSESDIGIDLEGARLPSSLKLFCCRIMGRIQLRDACLTSLVLDGSHLHGGMVANRMTTTGSVSLRRIIADDQVRLAGAKVGGNLTISGSQFVNKDVKKGKPLSTLKGKSKTRAALQLKGIDVAGSLDMREADIKDFIEKDNIDAEIGKTRLTTSFFGDLDLTSARVDRLMDSQDCWPDKGNLVLNRFRYGAIVGDAESVDHKTRLKWINLQNPQAFDADFWPQPYRQLAKALRETGHGVSASKVLIKLSKGQLKARRVRMTKDRKGLAFIWFGIWRLLKWIIDGFFGITVRYGYRPQFAVYWLLVFGLLGYFVFFQAQERGALKPNSAYVLRSEEWSECALPAPTQQNLAGLFGNEIGRAAPGQSQIECFQEQVRGKSFPQFSPFVYSFDTLLPIVDLEVQDYWIPDESKGALGLWARRYLWFQIVIGWALSLMAAAGLTGVIKTEK